MKFTKGQKLNAFTIVVLLGAIPIDQILFNGEHYLNFAAIFTISFLLLLYLTQKETRK